MYVSEEMLDVEVMSVPAQDTIGNILSELIHGPTVEFQSPTRFYQKEAVIWVVPNESLDLGNRQQACRSCLMAYWDNERLSFPIATSTFDAVGTRTDGY